MNIVRNIEPLSTTAAEVNSEDYPLDVAFSICVVLHRCYRRCCIGLYLVCQRSRNRQLGTLGCSSFGVWRDAVDLDIHIRLWLHDLLMVASV